MISSRLYVYFNMFVPGFNHLKPTQFGHYFYVERGFLTWALRRDMLSEDEPSTIFDQSDEGPGPGALPQKICKFL